MLPRSGVIFEETLTKCAAFSRPMVSGARFCFLGSAVLGGVAVLSACSGGFFFAEREPWRHEAEVQCINSGLVSEGSTVVRLSAIRGPGMCGMDFPLKVSAFDEAVPVAFADDPRPPGAIPSGLPNWPVVRSEPARPLQDAPAPLPARSRPRYESADQPISLNPPGAREVPGPENYDYRAPYGEGAATKHGAVTKHELGRTATSPRDDLSPEPYERRHLVNTDGANSGALRAPRERSVADRRRAPAQEDWADEPLRRPYVPPLSPSGASRPAAPSGTPMPVAVNPPATLACPIVSELDRWITGAVQPAAMRWFGSPVAEIKQISAYSCRGMNGNPNARISEHAFGNALDMAAFTLADGRTVTVKNGWHGLPEEQGFLRDVQAAACDAFTTVLAPGSNAYHYDHIHVDLMRHASGYRTCSPHAMSGEEVAARAGGKFAARRSNEPSATGALTPRRFAHTDRRESGLPDRALPLAQPGEDGED